MVKAVVPKAPVQEEPDRSHDVSGATASENGDSLATSSASSKLPGDAMSLDDSTANRHDPCTAIKGVSIDANVDNTAHDAGHSDKDLLPFEGSSVSG